MFTVQDMRKFAGEAWDQIGADIVDKWCQFNADYFDNARKPVPRGDGICLARVSMSRQN